MADKSPGQKAMEDLEKYLGSYFHVNLKDVEGASYVAVALTDILRCVGLLNSPATKLLGLLINYAMRLGYKEGYENAKSEEINRREQEEKEQQQRTG